MPLVAPVITATLPCKRPITLSLLMFDPPRPALVDPLLMTDHVVAIQFTVRAEMPGPLN
jgi:hypothetical protein